MTALASGSIDRWKRATAVVVVLTLCTLSVLVPVPSASLSGGITGQTRSGCTCHNVTEALSVIPSVDGLPGFYTPGEVYGMTLSFTGGPANVGENMAGFNLATSDGELIVPKGSALVRVDPSTGDATHTISGNDETSWEVKWRAPDKDTGTVTLTLVVNAVNGDAVQGPGDQWGRTEIKIQEGGRGGIQDAPLFWSVVGVAAILAIVAVAYLAIRGPRIELRR
jgi:hypothetical protein